MDFMFQFSILIMVMQTVSIVVTIMFIILALRLRHIISKSINEMTADFIEKLLGVKDDLKPHGLSNDTQLPSMSNGRFKDAISAGAGAGLSHMLSSNGDSNANADAKGIVESDENSGVSTDNSNLNSNSSNSVNNSSQRNVQGDRDNITNALSSHSKGGKSTDLDSNNNDSDKEALLAQQLSNADTLDDINIDTSSKGVNSIDNNSTSSIDNNSDMSIKDATLEDATSEDINGETESKDIDNVDDTEVTDGASSVDVNADKNLGTNGVTNDNADNRGISVDTDNDNRLNNKSRDEDYNSNSNLDDSTNTDSNNMGDDNNLRGVVSNDDVLHNNSSNGDKVGINKNNLDKDGSNENSNNTDNNAENKDRKKVYANSDTQSRQGVSQHSNDVGSNSTLNNGVNSGSNKGSVDSNTVKGIKATTTENGNNKADSGTVHSNSQGSNNKTDTAYTTSGVRGLHKGVSSGSSSNSGVRKGLQQNSANSYTQPQNNSLRSQVEQSKVNRNNAMSQLNQLAESYGTDVNSLLDSVGYNGYADTSSSTPFVSGVSSDISLDNNNAYYNDVSNDAVNDVSDMGGNTVMNDVKGVNNSSVGVTSNRNNSVPVGNKGVSNVNSNQSAVSRGVNTNMVRGGVSANIGADNNRVNGFNTGNTSINRVGNATNNADFKNNAFSNQRVNVTNNGSMRQVNSQRGTNNTVNGVQGGSSRQVNVNQNVNQGYSRSLDINDTGNNGNRVNSDSSGFVDNRRGNVSNRRDNISNVRGVNNSATVSVSSGVNKLLNDNSPLGVATKTAIGTYLSSSPNPVLRGVGNGINTQLQGQIFSSYVSNVERLSKLSTLTEHDLNLIKFLSQQVEQYNKQLNNQNATTVNNNDINKNIVTKDAPNGKNRADIEREILQSQIDKYDMETIMIKSAINKLRADNIK